MSLSFSSSSPGGMSGLIHSRAGLQQRQLGQLDWERDKTSHQEEDHTLELPLRCPPPVPPPLQGLNGSIHSRAGLRQSRLGQLFLERDKTFHQEDHTLEPPPRCPPTSLQGLNGLIHGGAAPKIGPQISERDSTSHQEDRSLALLPP